MDTSTLPASVAEYPTNNRTELFEFTEALVGINAAILVAAPAGTAP